MTIRVDHTKFQKRYEFVDKSPVIHVDPEDLKTSVQELHDQGLHHLSTIIGLEEEQRISVLYPLSKPEALAGETTFLKVQVPLEDPQVQSLVDIFPVADIYERELADLLGVNFGKPMERLLLPDDFPDGIYPLRKGMSGKELKDKLTEMGVGMGTTVPLKEIKDYEITDLSKQADYSIAVGPQHPTHKEPIRFSFFVKGEQIEDVKLRIGFNHRGIEKALEMGTWTQNLYLIERICGICSAAHQFAYSVTGDKVAGIADQVPLRAEWIRVLIAELERIHSHILWYGVLAHDAGYDMLFHITWKDREAVMDLLEMISGNRVNYSMYTIGGVRRDITPELTEKGIKILKEIRKKVVMHKEVMEKETTFVARMANIGILSKEDAIKYCAVGPTQRGSDVDFDLRRDFPYSGYKDKDIPMKVRTHPDCDIYASMVVRLDETIDSVDMCIHILENLPGNPGDIRVEMPRKFLEAEAHTRVEAPRGEDIHYIKSDGGGRPYRHKVRAPTMTNIVSLLERFKSMTIADIPMIIRLIDPCIGCMERVTFVDVNTNKIKTITGNELISKANRKYRLNEKIQLFW